MLYIYISQKGENTENYLPRDIEYANCVSAEG